MPHGQWLDWIESNLSFGPRRAQKFCRLAEHADQVPHANSQFAFASIDEALRPMRYACDGQGDLDDAPQRPPQPAPRGTADLSAHGQFAKKRDEAIELGDAHAQSCRSYRPAAVAKAQNAYHVPVDSDTVEWLSQTVAPL
jgi:hypothetical protein